MSISARQLELIRASFDQLQDDRRPRAVEFYDRLFAEAPELRPMFRDDLAGQGMRFMSTLAAIVDNLHDPDALEERYAELGASHAMLGVTAPMFKPMGRALIATLRESLGEGFTDETEAAWTLAYDEFAARIIERGGIPRA